MRIAMVLLAAATLLSSGCAMMLARCGKDLTALQTKDEVRAELGEPAASGVEDGNPFEEYRTRRTISRAYSYTYCSPAYPMMWVSTLGAIDLIMVPCELCCLVHGTLFGQTVRVTYDATGAVTGLALDGDSLDLGIYRRRNTLQETEAPLAGREAPPQERSTIPPPLPPPATPSSPAPRPPGS